MVPGISSGTPTQPCLNGFCESPFGQVCEARPEARAGDDLKACFLTYQRKCRNLAEKTFLDEALKCYRVQAFRACIVMTWNLAYNHLLNWLLADSTRLSQFNAAISKRNSKKGTLVVSKYDDFEDLKEREVIDICNIANLFNSSVYKILIAKLDRRNMAAHPSSVVVVQAQADDVVTDLVNNVVLALN